MENRSKNVKRNIGWGAINSVAAIFLPFLVRTAIIYSIGIEYVGLNSLFSSVLQMLSFAELGVGSAMAFSMYKPIAEGDKELVCALLNLYRKCYRIIGLIILVLGLILLPFIDLFIAGDVPVGINIYVLFVIYLMDNVSGYLLYAYKASLLSAHQRVDITSKVTIIVQVIKALLQVVAVVVMRNYYLYVIALLISTLVNNLLTEYITRKDFGEYTCRGTIPKEQFRELVAKIGGMMFQKIGSIILSAADTIVISTFLGLHVLGVYNGYYYVITAVTGVLAVLHRSLIPSVGNSLVNESLEKNKRDFERFHFLYVWIITWCCVCMLCLYQTFIALWQGAENTLSFIMVILFAIYFFVFHVGDMTHIYREALGLWWEGKFIPLISSVINLTLNLILVHMIGLPGILISTIVSGLLVNMPFVAYVVFKYYFKSLKSWVAYLGKIVYYFVVAILAAGPTYFVVGLIALDGIPKLVVSGIICVILPNVILLLIHCRTKVFKDSVKFVYGICPGKIKKYVPNIITKYI